MLHRISDLKGLTIAATDGDIGALDDVYFDSATWRVRYLVIDTGTWLPGRHVSIAPRAAQAPDWAAKRLPVGLTRAQVEGSPDVSTTPTVSRQQEIAWHHYYGYPFYWATPEVAWPPAASLVTPAPEAAGAEQLAAREPGEPHLHSAQEVRGFSIGALDGDIGRVADFLVDIDPWVIRYLVVDTRTWWPGKHVLVAPPWIREVSWRDSTVYAELTQETIRTAPEYDPSGSVERDYERRLYGHYRRPTYWE